MNESNEIQINKETYVKKSSISKEYIKSVTQIAVLEKGFVIVGNVQEKEGKTIIIEARFVRRWGTSRGLGELAEKGPLEDTKLDPSGDIITDSKNVIFLLNCNSENWG